VRVVNSRYFIRSTTTLTHIYKPPGWAVQSMEWHHVDCSAVLLRIARILLFDLALEHGTHTQTVHSLTRSLYYSLCRGTTLRPTHGAATPRDLSLSCSAHLNTCSLINRLLLHLDTISSARKCGIQFHWSWHVYTPTMHQEERGVIPLSYFFFLITKMT